MNYLKKISFAALFLIPFLAGAQGTSVLVGTWEGTLKVGVDLRIVFNIKQHPSGAFYGTADSPDQSAYGLTCDTMIFSSDTLTIEMLELKASYKGRLENDSTINGIFTQGLPFPLELKKVEKASSKKRSQVPKPPFPYAVENISFLNGDTRFAGTLTVPQGDGPFPSVVLISGSGPQDRDENIMGHPVFAVLADHLSRNGVMVLRYDDRGVGESGGQFMNATSEDFASDATAALNYLKQRKEADHKKLGMIGHSEGGMIAPIVAVSRKDIAFIVLLAAPGVPIIDLMAEQNEAVAKASGVSEKAGAEIKPLFKQVVNTIRKAKDHDEAISGVNTLLENWMRGKDPVVLEELNLSTPTQRTEYIQAMVQQLRSPWFSYFINFDPVPFLKKIKGKILALNGDRDIQVISSQNLPGIRAALEDGKADKFEILELPGLNHLFQPCNLCTLAEYGELEITFSPETLQVISDWIRKEIK